MIAIMSGSVFSSPVSPTSKKQNNVILFGRRNASCDIKTARISTMLYDHKNSHVQVLLFPVDHLLMPFPFLFGFSVSFSFCRPVRTLFVNILSCVDNGNFIYFDFIFQQILPSNMLILIGNCSRKVWNYVNLLILCVRRHYHEYHRNRQKIKRDKIQMYTYRVPPNSGTGRILRPPKSAVANAVPSWLTTCE